MYKLSDLHCKYLPLVQVSTGTLSTKFVFYCQPLQKINEADMIDHVREQLNYLEFKLIRFQTVFNSSTGHTETWCKPDLQLHSC